MSRETGAVSAFQRESLKPRGRGEVIMLALDCIVDHTLLLGLATLLLGVRTCVYEVTETKIEKVLDCAGVKK